LFTKLEYSEAFVVTTAGVAEISMTVEHQHRL